MTPPRMDPLRFTRGRHAYIVSRAYDGDGYIGLRDGRVIARDAERANVARALIRDRAN
jgi:hypothetical protein